MVKVKQELYESAFSPLLYRFYRYKNSYGRRICLSLVKRCERGQIYSATLRRIFSDYHGVKVGAYSYGECFLPGVFPTRSVSKRGHNREICIYCSRRPDFP